MTLCTAWVRHTNTADELVFATDSCLSGGERWKHGVKLFELPRQDCLICFAGDTLRTYPLILNLISSIKFDKHLSNPRTDISEILNYLTTLFTTLCNSIEDYGASDFKEVLGEFEFMFGGWSWTSNKFKIWTISYKHDIQSFGHDEIMDEETMKFVFIGDDVETANTLLTEEIIKNNKALSRNFDMEPFKVLLSMIRDTNYSSIDGTIQIAKIHAPGIVEFFGVMWPSNRGRKTFLGKDVTIDNEPNVNYIDPDTGEVISKNLPERLSNITNEIFGIHREFVENCYPSGIISKSLTPKKIKALENIFTDIAYVQFIEGIVDQGDQEFMQIND